MSQVLNALCFIAKSHLETILDSFWSQRSTGGNSSILMQRCMDDLKKESFGEWQSWLWVSKKCSEKYFWNTLWVLRGLFRIISICWRNWDVCTMLQMSSTVPNTSHRQFFKAGVRWSGVPKHAILVIPKISKKKFFDVLAKKEYLL